jgi:FkbM family methyltransferase
VNALPTNETELPNCFQHVLARLSLPLQQKREIGGTMLKQRLVNAIGKHNYLTYVKPLNDLYHSACVPFKGDGLQIIKRHLMPIGGTVLDIGANIGQFSAFAAPVVGKNGKIYAFEPVDSVACTLKRMVAIRRLNQVCVVKTALSDRTGIAEMKIPLKDGWKPQVMIAHLNGRAAVDMQFESVQLQTLDGFCHANSIGRVDFIKCDTEGHEFFVFSGGARTLAKHKPSVYCEIEEPYLERANLHPAAVFGLFKKLGYQSFLPTPQGDLKPVAGYQRRANYFFMHPSKMSGDLAQHMLRLRDA